MADAEKAIKGVLNSRTEEDGAVMYKVRYVGMDKSGDEWVKADAVSQEHVKNFEKRKAKKSTQDAPPKPQVEKKRKAEEEAGDGGGGEEAEDDGDGDGESKGSKLEFDDGGIGVEAGEVDPSLIITGPRRKRAAAAKAEQSSDWNNLLAGKLNALGDSDSDSD